MRANTSSALAIALAVSASFACGGGGGKSDSGGTGSGDGGVPAMSRAAVVQALATCTLDVYRAFVPAADNLAAASQRLAEDGAPERVQAAREAWLAAMLTWQEGEVFQYGPLAPRGSSPGAADVRDNIYAWPFVAPCFVEQELVSQRYQEADFASKSLINVRGLGAAEYLLFYSGTENHCPPTAALNSSGAWAAVPAEELARRKRRYAAVVAADIARRAHGLVESWEPGQGNFLGEVTRAGAGSQVFTSAQAALNAMSHALFYLENPVKDLKLGRPLGLRECATPPCLDQLESRFAQRSKRELERNLDGFDKLAFGCAAGGGLGFDDLLEAAGAADVATRMRAHLPAARTALAAIAGDDFRDALTENLPVVMTIYEELRQLVALMKTDFVTVLNLELPQGIQSDQD